MVLDCSDNFATRFAVNRACVERRTPLVSGAAIRMEGQVAVFDTRLDNSPCYHCLYREGKQEDQTCSGNGVLSPVVGIIGSSLGFWLAGLLGLSASGPIMGWIIAVVGAAILIGILVWRRRRY